MMRKTVFLIMLCWILICIAALTWKLMNNGVQYEKREFSYPEEPKFETSTHLQILRNYSTEVEMSKIDDDNEKINSLIQYCNLPVNEQISGAEGHLNDNWSLVGVIVMFRHGDRGPLIPISTKKPVNCSFFVTKEYRNFERDIQSSGLKMKSEQLSILPKSDNCKPGLLTKQGSSQLIELGAYLRRRYDVYCNFSTPKVVQNIHAYSTPYSRTVQSLRALLFGLVGLHSSLHVNISSVAEVPFCFSHCHCEAAGHFEKMHRKELGSLKKLSQSTKQLTKLKAALQESWTTKKNVLASSIKDVLLTYICHNSTPACGHDDEICLTPEVADYLNDCLHEEASVSANSLNLKKASLLKAYGLLHNVDQWINQWITQHKKITAQNGHPSPEFLFYSGHDLTLMYVLSALSRYDGFLPSYASRLVFEIFSNQSRYYVRVLWNGRELIAPSSARFLPKLLRAEMQKYFKTLHFKEACQI